MDGLGLDARLGGGRGLKKLEGTAGVGRGIKGSDLGLNERPGRFCDDGGPGEKFGLDEGPGEKLGLDEGPGEKLGLDVGPGLLFSSGLDDGPGEKLGLEDGPGEKLGLDEGPGLLSGTAGVGRGVKLKGLGLVNVLPGLKFGTAGVDSKEGLGLVKMLVGVMRETAGVAWKLGLGLAKVPAGVTLWAGRGVVPKPWCLSLARTLALTLGSRPSGLTSGPANPPLVAGPSAWGADGSTKSILLN